MTKTKIGVLGAGTWGTALARMLAGNGCDVTMWSALPDELKAMSVTHAHPNLPGMCLPADMHYTADIEEICGDRDVLLFAVPSVFVRSTARKAAPHIPDGQLIVDVAKGVEEKTLMTMSEIIEQELAADGKHTHCNVVALSGPTHAEEVARDMPTLIVAGSPDEAAARKVRCKAETFAGLSGMGDLIVTCTSMHSRNLHAGMLIGRGRDVETAKKEVGQVVEGINALPAACKLAKKYKVEMPIVNAVDDILSGRLAARDALATMMGRQLKQE